MMSQASIFTCDEKLQKLMHLPQLWGKIMGSYQNHSCMT